MANTKELSLDLHLKIVNLHKINKYGKKRITNILNISILTVCNIFTKYKQAGTIANFPCCGCPPKISPRNFRNLIRIVQEDCKLTALELSESLKYVGFVVSEKTLKRTLNKNELFRRHHRCKPLHNNKHKKARLEFFKTYAKSSNVFWDSVLFTDETKIELFLKNSQKFIWCKKNDAFNKKCSVYCKAWGGSLLLWVFFHLQVLENCIG